MLFIIQIKPIPNFKINVILVLYNSILIEFKIGPLKIKYNTQNIVPKIL